MIIRCFLRRRHKYETQTKTHSSPADAIRSNMADRLGVLLGNRQIDDSIEFRRLRNGTWTMHEMGAYKTGWILTKSEEGKGDIKPDRT